MSDDIQAASAILLAGGASSRMGQNKALLRVGGARLIDRVLAAVQPLVDDVVLVTNEPESFAYLRLFMTPDLEPNQGPLMGLYSGLQQVRHDLALLLACDMPFVSQQVLRLLLAQTPGWDVVLPDTADGLHPLHAVYRRSACLPPIAAALAARKRQMISFFPQVRVRQVTSVEIAAIGADAHSLMNVNTPEELAAAERWGR